MPLSFFPYKILIVVSSSDHRTCRRVNRICSNCKPTRAQCALGICIILFVRWQIYTCNIHKWRPFREHLVMERLSFGRLSHLKLRLLAHSASCVPPRLHPAAAYELAGRGNLEIDCYPPASAANI